MRDVYIIGAGKPRFAKHRIFRNIKTVGEKEIQ